jgi:serine/threonine-protein kinase
MKLPEMVTIPAGEFLYGEKKEVVYLPAYSIGKYPVTNAEYLIFVEETLRKWESPNGMNPGFATHPATYVTWHDAIAYCAWLSEKAGEKYRLPTEQEWEKAARGTDGREYPWGNEWEEGLCNTWESGISNTTVVGKYSQEGNSPYGCSDMAGNIWEWTGSWYNEREVCRVMRGGPWYLNRLIARCAFRGRGAPVLFRDGIGFRVVSPGSISDSCVLNSGSDFLCPHCGKKIYISQ